MSKYSSSDEPWSSSESGDTCIEMSLADSSSSSSSSNEDRFERAEGGGVGNSERKGVRLTMEATLVGREAEESSIVRKPSVLGDIFPRRTLATATDDHMHIFSASA